MRLLFLISPLLVLGLAVGTVALGQAGPLTDEQCNDVLGLNCTGDLPGIAGIVVGVVNAILGLLGLLAVIFIIYGGVQYIVSGGDEDKLKHAKYTILYALIGLIIVGLSVVAVQYFLGALT